MIRIALYFAIGLEFLLPFQTSSIADAATRRAVQDPRITDVLGQPISAEWSTFGYSTWDRQNSWAGRRLWIPLRGSKTDGRLHVRVENAAGPWLFTSLEFRASNGSRVDLLETGAPTSARPKGPVYLVALGSVTTVSLDSLAAYFRPRFDVNASVLPPIPLDVQGFDEHRQQFAGEALSSLLRRSLPDIVKDPTSSVIAVLENDLYSRRLGWSFLFTYRGDDQVAIVATKRLNPSRIHGWNRNALLETRIRKLIARDLGVLAFDLPLNNDPTSVLFDQLASVGDLDLMQERFEGLGALAEVNPPATAHRAAPVEATIALQTAQPTTANGRYPCFVVKPGVQWDGVHPIEAGITECLPGLRTDKSYDEFEVDLRGGLLKTRYSDLLVPDAMPLVFTRCYRSSDNVSRAFGAGWNHAYDIWPTGSRNPYTYVEVVMPDGDAIHYDRVSMGTGYADAVYRHFDTATPFLRSEIRWNGTGWDLKFQDGSSMLSRSVNHS